MTESVLLHGSGCMAPTGRLETESQARKWLDDAADAFCAHAGVATTASSTGSGVRRRKTGGEGRGMDPAVLGTLLLA